MSTILTFLDAFIRGLIAPIFPQWGYEAKIAREWDHMVPKHVPQKRHVITGRVLEVIDGDTLRMEANKDIYTVRLFGIDAPEKKQPFGATSTAHLSTLVNDRVIDIVIEDIDCYNRTVAWVFANNTDVNYEMVVSGMAWWTFGFAPKEKALAQAHRQAKRLGLGLWSDPNAVSPWEFRHLPKIKNYART